VGVAGCEQGGGVAPTGHENVSTKTTKEHVSRQ